MGAAGNERARELFTRALELPREGRASFLREACAGDDGLRREVERLLEADVRTAAAALDDFLAVRGAGLAGLEPAGSEEGAEGDAVELRGRRIGGYRIVRELGRGGMGVVYEAVQDSPRRTVALKVVTGALDASRERTLRFEREAEVLGRLQHPGIAQIFEAGEFATSDGRQPYFAMELVRGETLTRHAAGKGLGLAERIELVARVADAVDHAHQRGIVHRDLKPGNVLVDASGQPKVLDFGIARVTDADLRTVTLETHVGQVMGTLAYMSPEQAAGDPDRIDARSDVYSLGVLAYELLTGRLPYEIDPSNLVEAVRTVREDEPESASSLDVRLRGDVDTILGKALEKDVERRYASAAAFAEDLRRHLANRPILARPPSRLYRLGKFARRNRALVAGLAGVFAALSIGLVGTTLGYLEASRGREQARRAEDEALASAERARSTASFLRSILGGINPWVAQGEDTTLLRRILSDTEARIATELEGQPLSEAEIRQAIGLAYAAIGEPARAEPHLRRAWELFRQEEGSTSEAALLAAGQVGGNATTLGRYDVAEEILDAAIADAREHLGPSAPVTLGLERSLGILMHDAHRLTEARDVTADVIERMAANPAVDRATYLNACIPYTTLLLELDQDDEAQRALDRLIADASAELGESHPITIQALINRSALDQKHGRRLDALERNEKLLALSRRVNGDSDSTTLSAVRAVATSLREVGRWDEAEALFSDLVERCERKLGPENPQTLMARRGLAQVWDAQGRYAEADETLRAVAPALERRLGPEHRETLEAKRILGTVEASRGRHAEAVEQLGEVARVLREHGEGARQTLLLTESQLAVSLARLGRGEEALALQREVLAAHLAFEGPDHPTTLVDRTSLALTLNGLGRKEEAEEELLLSVAGHRRSLGDEAHETAKVIFNLGAFYQEQGELARALPCLAEASAVLASHAGLDHPEAAPMLRRLSRAVAEVRVAELGLDEASAASLAGWLETVAWALLRAERGSAALPLLEAALELRAGLEVTDPRMAWTQTLYGKALQQQGQAEEGGVLIESARGFLAPEDAAKL